MSHPAKPVAQFIWAVALFVSLGAVTWAIAANQTASKNEPPAAAPVRATIELVDVPHELSLPADSKANYFITAMIRGTAPKEVWLARAADAPFAVPVAPFGDGRYQINLADDRVALALRRTGGSGQCYVFARMPDGQVIQSAAVRFAMSRPDMAFTAVVGGTNVLSMGAWMSPGAVSKISAIAYPSLPGLKVFADIGDQRWQLQPAANADDPNDGTYELIVMPEIARAWAKAGSIKVGCDSKLYSNPAITVQAIPSKIDLPASGLTVEGHASRDVVIPGTNNYLSFHIGTVSERAAEVTVRRADESATKNDPPVGEANVLRFGGGQYVWVISEARPAPDGGSIQIRMVTGEQAEPLIVHTVIEQVRAMSTSISDRAMSFNGKHYNNDEAAEQLTELFRHSGGGSIANFLDAVRGREKESNSEVKLYPQQARDGTVSFRTWFERQVREMGWQPAAGTPAANAQPAENDAAAAVTALAPTR